MKGTGWTFLLLGIGLMFFAILYDTTVTSYASGSEGVYNLGRLQVQMMAWMAGIAAFGLGIVLITAGVICGRAFQSTDKTDDQCRWCGQTVAASNTPCAELSPVQWEKHRAEITNARCLEALAQRGLRQKSGL